MESNKLTGLQREAVKKLQEALTELVLQMQYTQTNGMSFTLAVNINYDAATCSMADGQGTSCALTISDPEADFHISTDYGLYLRKHAELMELIKNNRS